jgi:hypothetical protein
MRVGTVLDYIRSDKEQSVGVVEHLIDADAVSVIDQSGFRYLIHRGQAHKRPEQYDAFCNNLRAQFKIEVGPCQKSTFGHKLVDEAKKRFKKRVQALVGLPIPVANIEQAKLIRETIKNNE